MRFNTMRFSSRFLSLAALLVTAGAANAASSITYSPFNGCANVVIQTFAVDGTYTPTQGMIWAIAEAVGGGGGGGGAITTTAGTVNGAGGGGGGEYAKSVFSAATIGASKAVDIGAAGAAGTAGNNAGGAGADTTLGTTLLVAKAGAGGGGAAAGSVGGGGAGGTGGTGTVLIPGGPGTSGNAASIITMTYASSGRGGNSSMGWGGRPRLNTAGLVGTGYGAGGSGGGDYNATGDKAGGAGTAGYMYITECIR